MRDGGPADPRSPAPDPRRRLLVPLLLASGALAFLPGLGAYFLSDDWVLLGWTRASSLGEVAAFFDPQTEWFYRPLVKGYYWAGQSLFGLRAVPFHIVSLLLHVANAYLVYRLVCRLGLAPWGAGLLAALVFLLNPHHAETVSWVAAVGDLLGVLAILSSLLLSSRFVRAGGYGWLGVSLGVFALGLLSRETAVMLPPLVLLYVLVFREARTTKRWPWLAAHFGVLAAYLVMMWLGRSGEGALARGGLEYRALNFDSILLGVADYVHGLLPGGAALAGLPLDTLRWVVWVEAALAGALAFGLWRWARRVALFGLGWMLATPLLFVPFSGPTDRYFYLPSVGFALIVGDLLGAVPRLVRGPQVRGALVNASALAAVALLLANAVGVYRRALDWREAGRVAGGVLNDTLELVPKPPPGAAVYYAGVPPFLNGVPLFGNGLPEALRLLYNNSSLSALPATCDAPPPPDATLLRFKGDGVERISLEELCRGK